MPRMPRAIPATEPPFFETEIPIPLEGVDINLLATLEHHEDIIDLALAVAEKRVSPQEAIKALGAPGSARGRGNGNDLPERSNAGRTRRPDGHDVTRPGAA